MTISFWITAKGLSTLHREKGEICRFYDDIKASALIGGKTFAASNSAWTACNEAGDKIGSQSQLLDVDISGDSAVSSAVRALAAGPAITIKVENGPRKGTTLAVPTTGLKEVMKSISVCPPPVRSALTQ